MLGIDLPAFSKQSSHSDREIGSHSGLKAVHTFQTSVAILYTPPRLQCLTCGAETLAHPLSHWQALQQHRTHCNPHTSGGTRRGGLQSHTSNLPSPKCSVKNRLLCKFFLHAGLIMLAPTRERNQHFFFQLQSCDVTKKNICAICACAIFIK